MLRVLLLLTACFLALPFARAQSPALATFETGAAPVGIPTLGNDGCFYGTTSQGGNANKGTVYRLTPGGTLTSLSSFTGPNGTAPATPLTRGADGLLYGTTGKGSSDDGTIFRLNPDGTVTTLYLFPADNKYAPSALTLGPDGSLYGTLRKGGAAFTGSTFRFTPPGTFTTIAEFNAATGKEPVAPLLLGRDGNFYGTTTTGGSTVYRLTPSGVLTVLQRIDYNTSGFAADSPLVQDADGNLYGVFGGYFQVPAGIFRVAPSGAYTVLTHFNDYYEYAPQPVLAPGPDGKLYGSTPSGDKGGGTGSVFRLEASGTMTTLVRFATAQGGRVRGFAAGPDGAFYGVAELGGSASQGTVFRVTTAGVLTTLYTFNHTDGWYPSGGLILALDGNFYGVTEQGGAVGGGNVFRVTPGGVRTTVVSFDYSGGGASPPHGRLCPSADGASLYGATDSGGASGQGTIFQMTTGGVLSIVHSFAGGSDGAQPEAGVILGADGALYGTTYAGGASGKGTLFRLTTDGVLTTLHSFTGTDGSSPQAELALGSDGSLYGTTIGGGAGYRGTVFRLAPSGVFTVLASLPNASSGPTRGALALAGDGNLYGVLAGGGTNPTDKVFRVSPGGGYSTAADFGDFEQAANGGGLTLGADGNLYGATSFGGYGAGELFRITTGGVLTRLRAFDGARQGVGPIGSPVFGADGTLYGVASHGVWHLSTAMAAEAWRQQYFGTAANTQTAADGADPDGDGVPNLLERAFGQNPLLADAAAGPITTRDANGRLTISARRGADASDLVFTAESSADLVTWSSTDVTVLYSGATFFQARDNGPTGSRRFLRLRVTQP